MLAATVGTSVVMSCTLSSSSTKTGSKHVLEHKQCTLTRNYTIGRKTNLNLNFIKNTNKNTMASGKCRENNTPFGALKPWEHIAAVECEVGWKPCEVKRLPVRTFKGKLLTCPLLLIGRPTGPGSGSEMGKSIGNKKGRGWEKDRWPCSTVFYPIVQGTCAF